MESIKNLLHKSASNRWFTNEFTAC